MIPQYSTQIDFESNISFSHSGIPETTPIHSVNRQCSSGLQACMTIAGEELDLIRIQKKKYLSSDGKNQTIKICLAFYQP